MNNNAYKKSGVDIEKGDLSSASAYEQAMKTFSSREGMIASPLKMEGAFAGALDFGSFHLVQATDGTGTKMKIAEKLGKFDTIGYDLLAMVCDDIVCTGAETVSITNSIDIGKVDPVVTKELLKGLSKACQEQKVIISGGEIAEVGNTVNSIVWNASGVGILEKDKFLLNKKITPGDAIITLREEGFRSNGFSLVRKVLRENLGKNWVNKNNWGERVLKPSQIYSSVLLEILGRYGEKPRAKIKGIAHITGGGIQNNLSRILPNNLKAEFYDLFDPPEMMQEIQEMGKISDKDMQLTFNMGNGMMIICTQKDSNEIISSLKNNKVDAKICGNVVSKS